MPILAPPIASVGLALKQGADATILLTVVDANNMPIIDPTGYTVRAQIRASNTGVVLFEWNTTIGAGLGVAVISYSATTLTSTLSLTVTAAQSALFGFTMALWDCFMTSPTSKTSCLAEGPVTVDPSITH